MTTWVWTSSAFCCHRRGTHGKQDFMGLWISCGLDARVRVTASRKARKTLSVDAACRYCMGLVPSENRLIAVNSNHVTKQGPTKLRKHHYRATSLEWSLFLWSHQLGGVSLTTHFLSMLFFKNIFWKWSIELHF